MIEEIRELLLIIEKIPSLTVWVLAGFGIYKLVMYLSTTGAVVILTKLAIERLHDYKVRPKETIIRCKFESILLNEEASKALEVALYTVKDRYSSIDLKNRGLFQHSYIHGSDVKWLQEAIYEKIEKEKNKGTKVSQPQGD